MPADSTPQPAPALAGPVSPALGTNADSRISLATVSAELAFIARYIADYGGKDKPPKDEQDRIRTALRQAQADLNFVVVNLIQSVLGDGGQDLGAGQT